MLLKVPGGALAKEEPRWWKSASSEPRHSLNFLIPRSPIWLGCCGWLLPGLTCHTAATPHEGDTRPGFRRKSVREFGPCLGMLSSFRQVQSHLHVSCKRGQQISHLNLLSSKSLGFFFRFFLFVLFLFGFNEHFQGTSDLKYYYILASCSVSLLQQSSATVSSRGTKGRSLFHNSEHDFYTKLSISSLHLRLHLAAAHC